MTFSQAVTYLPFWLVCALCFSLGACIGSFLNVIIYRIPIGPEKRATGMAFNINAPRSHCPICKHQLTWYENIPLLSWTIQAAKCRNCKTTIPARYPAIEFAIAFVGAVTWFSTESWQHVTLMLLISMALVPAIWWMTTRTAWNRFMLSWIIVLLLASMVFGGYIWTAK